MEGERGQQMSEHAAFIATVLAVFEQADANLTNPEKEFIRYLARQLFVSGANGEPLDKQVAKRLKTWERVVQALEQEQKSKYPNIPEPFRTIDPKRARELIAILSARILMFAETKVRN